MKPTDKIFKALVDKLFNLLGRTSKNVKKEAASAIEAKALKEAAAKIESQMMASKKRNKEGFILPPENSPLNIKKLKTNAPLKKASSNVEPGTPLKQFTQDIDLTIPKNIREYAKLPKDDIGRRLYYELGNTINFPDILKPQHNTAKNVFILTVRGFDKRLNVDAKEFLLPLHVDFDTKEKVKELVGKLGQAKQILNDVLFDIDVNSSPYEKARYFLTKMELEKINDIEQVYNQSLKEFFKTKKMQNIDYTKLAEKYNPNRGE